MLELETERLRLRPPVPGDAEALAPMYADPAVMRYLGDGRTLTPKQTARSVQRMIDRWEADGFGLFTTVRKDDQAVIGRVGLIVWNPETWKTTSADADGPTELEVAYVESLGERRVFPHVDPDDLREALGGPLPEEPVPAEEVVEELAAAAEPGLVAMGSGRYFGFVIGGALPAALAADWLATAWDQNAGLYAGGPSASVVEQVTREWIVELLGLPAESSIGFVTGTQMAHVTGLAAARWHVLDAVGWDVGAKGLTGAPPVLVLAGEKRHATVDRALRLLGLGVPTVVADDSQGRLVPDALGEALGDGPTIICAQAGEADTRAFDPPPE